MNKHFNVADGVSCYDNTIEINGKLFGCVALNAWGADGDGMFTINHVFDDIALAVVLEDLPAGWTANNDGGWPYRTIVLSYSPDAENAQPDFVWPIFPPITVEANAGQLEI